MAKDLTGKMVQRPQPEPHPARVAQAVVSQAGQDAETLRRGLEWVRTMHSLLAVAERIPLHEQAIVQQEAVIRDLDGQAADLRATVAGLDANVASRLHEAEVQAERIRQQAADDGLRMKEQGHDEAARMVAEAETRREDILEQVTAATAQLTTTLAANLEAEANGKAADQARYAEFDTARQNRAEQLQELDTEIQAMTAERDALTAEIATLKDEQGSLFDRMRDIIGKKTSKPVMTDTTTIPEA